MRVFQLPTIISARALKQIFSDIASSVADESDVYAFVQLVTTGSPSIDEQPHCRARFLDVAKSRLAALVYSDYSVIGIDGTVCQHPVIDYQDGSVRDDFDFGPLVAINLVSANEVLAQMDDYEYAGWYALRLGLSQKGALVHIPETLYACSETERHESGEAQFDYVNPRNREVQLDMERAFTDFLHRINALLTAPAESVDVNMGSFPVEVSVIIPVRNRERTIADAVNSALAQRTDAPYNVIVVDNHSDDATTEIVDRLAANNANVIHIIPERNDLGIGGCWNLAVNNPQCGRFAIQLDSDDVYNSPDTIQRIVDKFRTDRCAMVIGSYELVDFDGNPIPPGLIDHKEWTDDNGRNNALRINGLGAPRAFFTPVFRQILLPNVSYGEDYAMGLRISRQYRIGRIYDSLYLCRRWDGNSDASLSVEKVNRNNYYKDFIRTNELCARKHGNAKQ